MRTIIALHAIHDGAFFSLCSIAIRLAFQILFAFLPQHVGCVRRRLVERQHATDLMANHAAEMGDVLVVAGKGHEQGQTIGTQVLPFDDADTIRALAGAT